jgi:putative ABC transport system ATP-binding protein
MIPLFISLDLPKQIVNGPIQGSGYEDPTSRRTYFDYSVPVPEWFSDTGEWRIFEGVELDRLTALYVLSGIFLGFVVVNGLFKYYINIYKGRLGERMLRRMRYELVDRVLRFPLGQFRRVKASEVATMVKDELQPLGGFTGEAFVQPVFLAGQAVTALVFIFVQSISLGFLALGMLAVQMILIPRLRRRLLVLSKERQLATRDLSGRVGEIVDGIASVHLNDTSNYERADITGRLGRIFDIRYAIFRRKFIVKVINNFLAQVTPFLFYLIGGYFAIRGQLDIGQLVAVIAAYKELPSPVKELIDWDQQRLDVQVKYSQVIEQFDIEGLMEPEHQTFPSEPVQPLAGDIRLSNVSVIDESGATLLDQVSTTIRLSEMNAVIGPVGGGADHFAELLGRLLKATRGRVSLSNRIIDDLPEWVTGRRIGYVDADTFFPQGTLRDSVLYSLKRLPPEPIVDDGDHEIRRRLMEAQLTGNMEYDVEGDWVDYEAAGVDRPADLDVRIRAVLKSVGLEDDVIRLGLRTAIMGEQDDDLQERLLAARGEFRRRLDQSTIQAFVDPFDPDRYSKHASILENLIFGSILERAISRMDPTSRPYMRTVLRECGLDAELFTIGRAIAETVVELFADLEPDNPLLDQLSLMQADEIPDYQAALARTAAQSFEEAGADDQQKFLRLAFDYVEPQHRLGLLDAELQDRIVEARHKFSKNLPEELQDAFAFYNPEEYNPGASVQDNILFGRIASGMAEAVEQIDALLDETLEALELKAAIFRLGLRFNAGSGGKRLSIAQRQKLALARALIKQPDLLIVNRAMTALGADGQRQIIDEVLRLAHGDGGHGFGVVWVLASPELAERFDSVLEFDKGALTGRRQSGESARDGERTVAEPA